MASKLDAQIIPRLIGKCNHLERAFKLQCVTMATGRLYLVECGMNAVNAGSALSRMIRYCGTHTAFSEGGPGMGEKGRCHFDGRRPHAAG